VTGAAFGQTRIPRAAGRPRVGCLGAGWIGRARASALAATGDVSLVAVAEPDPEARQAVAADLPRAQLCDGLEELLARDLDGIVIATPSAQHAAQATAALRGGAAVFCEKPLGRSAAETREVVDAAREEDLLLSVDLSYRHTRAAQALAAELASGQLGPIHAVELVFHNAYGPDKPWFTQRAQSGGGCLIDLGTHLIDLGLWLTGATELIVDAAHVSRRGRPVAAGSDEVEDFALAQMHTPDGIAVRVACSWFLPAGRDCVLQATLYGTDGAVTLRNLDGSFYDFVAERHDGTATRRLSEPGDDWGGGAVAAWGRALRADGAFDPATGEELIGVAQVIDAIYGAAA
jgi:predicted dehydrogenase